MQIECYISKVESARAAARAAAKRYLAATLAPEQLTAGGADTGSATMSPMRDPKIRQLLAAALDADDLFSSSPLEIYDVTGSLVFRDFSHALDGAMEYRVRTFANCILGSVIASLGVAPIRDHAAALALATRKAARYRLGELRAPDRIVCYVYPRLGVVFQSGARGDVVMDLESLKYYAITSAAGAHCWQPYDGITDSQAQLALDRYAKEEDDLLSLSFLPSAEEPPERKIPLELVVQEGQNFCAVASATMILRHHGLPVTQQKLVSKFGDRERIRLAGTPPMNQVKGLNKAGRARGLKADIVFGKDIENDWNKVLPRLKQALDANRPVQRQLRMPTHVDVVAGWRGVIGSSGFMLWIFDPVPPNGQERLDRWDLVSSNINDLIFVGPEAE